MIILDRIHIPETAGSPTPDGFTRYYYRVFRKEDKKYMYEATIDCVDWEAFCEWIEWATENDNNYFYKI